MTGRKGPRNLLTGGKDVIGSASLFPFEKCVGRRSLPLPCQTAVLGQAGGGAWKRGAGSYGILGCPLLDPHCLPGIGPSDHAHTSCQSAIFEQPRFLEHLTPAGNDSSSLNVNKNVWIPTVCHGGMLGMQRGTRCCLQPEELPSIQEGTNNDNNSNKNTNSRGI